METLLYSLALFCSLSFLFVQRRTPSRRLPSYEWATQQTKMRSVESFWFTSSSLSSSSSCPRSLFSVSLRRRALLLLERYSSCALWLCLRTLHCWPILFATLAPWNIPPHTQIVLSSSCNAVWNAGTQLSSSLSLPSSSSRSTQTRSLVCVDRLQKSLLPKFSTIRLTFGCAFESMCWVCTPRLVYEPSHMTKSGPSLTHSIASVPLQHWNWVLNPPPCYFISPGLHQPLSTHSHTHTHCPLTLLCNRSLD